MTIPVRQHLRATAVMKVLARAQVVLGTLLVLMMSVGVGRAQDRPTYPTMAPIDQYLMDRNAEIALARSAAPDSISRDAKIMFLTSHGYETAAEGKNGFLCAVERGWMAPFESADFWNPKIRGPLCLNPQAARSIFPLTIKQTEFALAGLSKEQIKDKMKGALDQKELPPFEPGAMSYMLSKNAYLTGNGGNLCHLMIYAPVADAASWGADLPKSPVMFGWQFQDAHQPITVFLVPVSKWSDGTDAPQM